MFIASKNNILIPGDGGRDAVRIPRGFVGSIPDWVGGTAYFKALVRCGKITISKDGEEKKARNSPSKAAKGKRAAPRAETPPSAPRPDGDETPPEAPGEKDGETGEVPG